MKRNQNSDHNPPQKVLSCRYNMDTNRLEAQLMMALFFPSTVSPLRTNTATPLRSEQS